MSYVTTAVVDVDKDTLSEDSSYNGTLPWFVINIIIVTITVFGNMLTIFAIIFTRKINSVVANRFVFSLAVSDLFVGFTVPYHMAFYTIEGFGTGRLNCILRFVLISFACASSIINLLLIATDRYIAIVYPLRYTRLITPKSSLCLTIFGWSFSFSLAAIPLFWNDWRQGVKCEILEVLPNNYFNYIVCPMFVLIWFMMLLLYSRICSEATGHAKRIRAAGSAQNILAIRDSKSFQVMVTILGCFTICWLPYLVIAIYLRQSAARQSTLLYEMAFNLAVANSGMNPIIYAWKNHNFRASFKRLINCETPNCHNDAQFVTNHVPSKKSSMSNGTGHVVCVNGDVERVASVCDKVEMDAFKVHSTVDRTNGSCSK